MINKPMVQIIGQAKVIETYKHHQLSLTSLMCFIGTLQAIAVTFVAEHNLSVWRIGWDMSLLAAAYAVRIYHIFQFYFNTISMSTKALHREHARSSRGLLK